MLITRHFVLVHMQKTGGSFLRTIAAEHLPEDWLVPSEEVDWGPRGYYEHHGFRHIPPAYRDLPVICFVRNPWDWYVSWYETHKLLPQEKSWMWKRIFEYGRADFATTVAAACTGRKDGARLTRMDGSQSRVLNLMDERGCDFYSLLFQEMVRGGVETGRLEVGRFERLREDFLGFLERNAISPPDRFAAAIREAEPINVSARRAYREYYDDELRELVRERARDIIGTYGYEF